MRIAALTFAFAFAACTSEHSLPQKTAHTKPKRIISLDFCADQYVLKLADRDNILALSPEATQDHSYLRLAAADLPVVRPRAENVIALQPDLVVRSYGGGPNATSFFTKAGIPVLNINWAGDFESIKTATKNVAKGLDEAERGTALVTEIESRLAALPKFSSDKNILYMTPTGVTTGPGSLINELLLKAGFTNFETRPGWHPLPLERLTTERPDKIAASFYDTSALSHNLWSAARHPIARQHLNTRSTIPISGAWTACGAWFAVDAVEALAKANQ
jgi:iron complex transport system substrate-binding protein